MNQEPERPLSGRHLPESVASTYEYVFPKTIPSDVISEPAGPYFLEKLAGECRKAWCKRNFLVPIPRAENFMESECLDWRRAYHRQARHPSEVDYSVPVASWSMRPSYSTRCTTCAAGALDQAAPLPDGVRRLQESRMGRPGKREFVRVLRLLETFPGRGAPPTISRGATGFCVRGTAAKTRS